MFNVTTSADIATHVGNLRIAAACLLMYWHQDDRDVLHWMLKATTDIILDFRSVGTGSAFAMSKFGPAANFLHRQVASSCL